jgi:hypothetical protein
MILRRITKAILYFLISLAGLVFLLFIAVNLPFAQRSITVRINQILNKASLPIEISSVKRVLLSSLRAEGVLIRGSEGDTIIYAARLKAEFKLLAILKHKVILPHVYISDAKIKLLRNKKSEQINIAAAFSHGKKTEITSPDTKKVPWDVSFSTAEISGIKFLMADSVAGIYIDQDVRKIIAETESMSIVTKVLIARSLEIEGLTGNITINSSKNDKDTASSQPWNFGLSELNASDINFTYDSPSGKQRFDIVGDKILLKARKTDIKEKIIDFDQILISSTDAILSLDKEPSENSQVKKDGKYGKSDPFPWNVRGNLINLQEISFRTARYSDSEIDTSFSAFSVLQLSMQLKGIALDNDAVNADLKSLSFDLGNGFSISKMNGSIVSGSDKTSFAIKAETRGSSFEAEGAADAGLFQILNNPGSINETNISIGKSTISVNDLLIFKPGLINTPGIKTLSANPILVNGTIQMKNSILKVPVFYISQSPGLDISIKGLITNILLPKTATLDLEFGINKIDNEWLSGLIAELKPDLPKPVFASLALNGTLSDSLVSPGLALKIESDLGRAEIKGSFDAYKDKFTLQSTFKRLQLGSLLRNQILGPLSGSADISGSGIKSKSLAAKATVLIDSIFFKDYNYTRARIEGEIHPGEYSARLFIDDPSVGLAIDANMKSSDSELRASVNGNFRANLFDLHFLKDSLITEGILSADFSKKQNNFDANALLSAIKITTPREIISLEKIGASLDSDSLSTRLTTKADFLNLNGHIGKTASDLPSFLQDLKNHLKSFLVSSGNDSLHFYSSLPVIDLNIDLGYHKIVSLFVPDTSLMYKNVTISANTNSEDNSLRYSIKGKEIKYNSLEVEDLDLSISDSASWLDMKLVADKFSVASQKFDKLQITNHFKEWQSLINISISDNLSKQIYSFDLKSETDSSKIILKSPSQEFVMNGTKWTLDSPDLLVVNLDEKTFSPSLMMHTENSVLTFLTEADNLKQTYKLNLKNIKLNSLIRAELLPGNPELSLNGSAIYTTDKAKSTQIKSDILLSNVSWSGLNYNSINLNGQFTSDTTGGYEIDMLTRLDSAEISLKGTKPAKGNRSIDIRLLKIPVNTIQPFVNKYLSDLKGYLSGDLNISSNNDVESFTGEFSLEGWNLRINALNSAYRLTNDRIRLSGKKVFFEKFKILDSLNNELLVNGSIDFSNKKSVTSDLEITSSNLQVMNKKEDKNSALYGDIFIDARLSIKGPVASPVLKGKITLSEGTDIYFRQMENLNISESAKVITFVSSKASDESKRKKQDAGLEIYNKASVESIIEIDPDTRLNIKLSKKMFNIDLVIEGGGELNYNMLVNSQVNLSGKYEVSMGSADLKMIGWPNKAFTIARGGFIRWDSKLDDPELQFEAFNRVRSSYTNPVDNKERYVDFDVKLKIANRLSDMDVQFTITTADQYLMSIINTLSPDEQMRQAITILLFEKIDLPGISTTSSYVTEQVNQMVASQLNALTKTTIKGIDISFGIDTYTQATESGGKETKTSLSYEVSRSLMNNRAKIQLSGRMNDATNQPTASSLSLNNVSFEYRLDSAATKFLKVYNEHTYEDVFEGEVIKTGIGITYRKNYPTLRDIWRKEEKTVEPRKTDK